MSLISLLIWIIILLVIIGLLIYAMRYIPIPQPFRNIIIVVIILIAVLILLQQLGILGRYLGAPV